MDELQREIAKRQGLPFDDIQFSNLPEPVDTCTPEYRDLLERIVKGMEYIQSIDEKHPRWKAANEKYDRLCGEAFEMRCGRSI